MVRLVFAFMIVAFTVTANAEEKFSFRDGYDYRNSTFNCTAAISADRRVVRDRQFTVEVRCTNQGQSPLALYNPMFRGLIQAPGALVIYDSEHRYIGDLVAFGGGSRREVGAADWMVLDPESYIGCKVRLLGGFVPNSVHDSRDKFLTPGHYYLQLVFYNGFMGMNEAHGYTSVNATGENFRRRFERGELLRSNVIEIEITE